MYAGRVYCTVCERGNVQGICSFSLPIICEDKRQTRSGIEERHEGMLAGIYTRVFDDLLTLERRGMRAIAYADDLLILVSENSRMQIETAGQTAIGIIEEWCTEEKLSAQR